MTYSIGEVAKMLNINSSTIRYYDKEGLLLNIKHKQGGIRIFDEEDLAWLRMIECLKKSLMSIKEIKVYIDLVKKGDKTIDERLKLFENRREILLKQIEEINHSLKVLDYKCWYYKTAKKEGTTKNMNNKKDDDIPEEYRQIRNELRKL